ncbi:hypothetical protein FHX44_11104 [Pseudonocardia hierapolitana]|uniref:Uncharacterized protein n=1 Tax=Pseudonocardia hierapolitana TaxID=1128676 RepID=A0A561SH82_9PSEU|nr:hypothetical protein FHX44_11104 [Pseudonocardia hierapolitana]
MSDETLAGGGPDMIFVNDGGISRSHAVEG